MEKLISVIMSTYNEQTLWVKKSIESILDQSYKNIEFIIVLDNPINHKLKELLSYYEEKDERVKILINEENYGLVKSLNIALKHCKGTYIARMDADDISLGERLELQKEYLEINGLDFVFSGLVYIDENGSELYATNNSELSYNKVKRILEVTNISNHPTWFLKRDVYDQVGGYRSVPHCEDYDFTLRCLKKNFKIGKMGQNVLKYRLRANSISRTNRFEQSLNSKGVLKLYIDGRIEDLNSLSDMLKKSRELAFSNESTKYLKAIQIYDMAIKNIKSGEKVKGATLLLKSFTISKYHAIQLIDLFKYKIKFFSY